MLALRAVREAARVSPDAEARDRAAGVRDAIERELFGLRRVLAAPGRRPLFALAVSPDGREVVTGGTAERLEVWDTRAGRRVDTIDVRQQVDAIAYHPTGRDVAVGGRGRLVAVDAATRTATPFRGVTDTIAALAYAPDGGRLLAATDRGLVWWGTADRARRRPAPLPDVPLHAAAVRLDGRGFATGGKDGVVQTWTADPPALVSQTPAAPAARDALAVAYTPDGKRLAVGTRAGLVRVYDAESGAAVRSVPAHAAAICRLAFSADGRWAATASEDGTVGLWDAGTWERTHTYRGDGIGMYGVAFAPDRPAVYACGADGRVYEWSYPR